MQSRRLSTGELAFLAESVPPLGSARFRIEPGDEAVASALYCFCPSPDDYRNTVLAGANTVGDSDSIACIAGAISGAYKRLSGIPEHWRRDVESSDMLHEVARDLLSARMRASR